MRTWTEAALVIDRARVLQGNETDVARARAAAGLALVEQAKRIADALGELVQIFADEDREWKGKS